MVLMGGICASLNHILILWLLLPVALHSFQPAAVRPTISIQTERNALWDDVQSLWEEIIEVSTYGPSERKMLKERRLRAQQVMEGNDDGQQSEQQTPIDMDDLSLDAFRLAVAADSQEEEEPKDIGFDGYNLQDLLIQKWGVPLDIDFQRQPNCVYCTVMPVVLGSRKCRHESELAYLMHLQGVVEILHRYNNLDLFLDYINTTNKTPKVGTDSVPFRMQLTNEQLQKIL